MSQPKIVTASLEGMRVLVDEKRCELQEYNFVSDEWVFKDASPRPMPRDRAEGWLEGWNRVDRFAAMKALAEPEDYRAATSAGSRRHGQPQP